MNTERASYFTERSYTTSEAENKKDIFEYWKKILGEDTLRVAEKCYGIDLVKVLNSENYVCENNHVMSEMEKVKIELFEKPINYNYSGFKGEKLAFDNFFIPLIISDASKLTITMPTNLRSLIMGLAILIVGL
jgi:hypothetical protein